MKLKAVFLLPLFLLSFLLPHAPARAERLVVDVPGTYVSSDGDDLTVSVTNDNAPDYDDEVVMTPAQKVYVQNSRKANSYANAELSGMNFSNQNLTGADFSNATLVGADFSGAILRGANFSNANLNGANLTNADFSGADLSNASLNKALAINTRFDGANLRNADMSGLIKQTVARPTYVTSQAITQALRIDPGKPAVPRKIDLTVNFDFNSDKLTTDGAKQVAEIASALADPSLGQAHIIVEGHTDGVGGDDYNLKLSYRRAMSVMQTLTERYNIPEAMLSAKGYGKKRPIASNETDLGRAQNRRVTLVNMGQAK